MERVLNQCRLRPARLGDAESIARGLNDRAIWRNLRDHVPHPYALADAQAFLARVMSSDPQQIWVIDIAEAAVGAIGVHPRDDVYRGTLEIGYWVSRAFHGRGIASEVVPAIVEHVFATWPNVVRIQGDVFAWNAASARVLEKSGFVREGVLRDAVTKDGELTDLWTYAILRRDRDASRQRAAAP